MISTMIAIIGDRSIAPMSGRIRLIGARIGSVIWYTTRTTGIIALSGPMGNHESSTLARIPDVEHGHEQVDELNEERGHAYPPSAFDFS